MSGKEIILFYSVFSGTFTERVFRFPLAQRSARIMKNKKVETSWTFFLKIAPHTKIIHKLTHGAFPPTCLNYQSSKNYYNKQFLNNVNLFTYKIIMMCIDLDIILNLITSH